MDSYIRGKIFLQFVLYFAYFIEENIKSAFIPKMNSGSPIVLLKCGSVLLIYIFMQLSGSKENSGLTILTFSTNHSVKMGRFWFRSFCLLL